MGNSISKNIKTGTIGELLVQTRLLEYGVQAAPPLKDSGNDLIALLGEVFKGVQVKTTTNRLHKKNLPKHYHIPALVKLAGEGNNIHLDKSDIYLVPRDVVNDIKLNEGGLIQYKISQELVDELFSEN